jgi:hypothetical protein
LRQNPFENPVAKTTGHYDVIPQAYPPNSPPQCDHRGEASLGKCLNDAGGIVTHLRWFASLHEISTRGVQLAPRQDRPRSPAHVTHSLHHMPQRDGSGQMEQIKNVLVHYFLSNLNCRRVDRRLDLATSSKKIPRRSAISAPAFLNS